MNVLSQMLRLACACKAKIMCNGVFVSGMDPRRLAREDAAFHPFFRLAVPKIDRERESVTCTILGSGLFGEKAIHVGGIGAVLLSGTPEEKVRSWRAVEARPAASLDATSTPWPAGDLPRPPARTPGIDASKVESAVARLFDERGRRNPLRTRRCSWFTTGTSSASATRRDSVRIPGS